MDLRTDAELVGLAQSGDREAFGALAERYATLAQRVAYRMIGHQDVSQDLAQDAIVQAYLSVDRIRDPTRFQSWLYGIVLNLCRHHLRVGNSAATLSYETLLGGTQSARSLLAGVEPGPQEVAEAREIAHVDREAVGMLSLRNRAATLMYYYDQFSVREIAAGLGISVSAVKGRLHKSRNALRELLEPTLGVAEDVVVASSGDGVYMIKVSIADIIVNVKSDDGNNAAAHASTWYVVVLKEEAGDRALPIWIGPVEAQAIVIGLKDPEIPRPLTYHLMANLLEAAGAELEEVRVETLRDDTYFAVVKLRVGNSVREVDARPSDAFALAVYLGAPIYVEENVMSRAGRVIAEDASHVDGEGMDRIASQMAEAMKELSAWKLSPEDAERSHEFLSGVFGAGPESDD